MAYETYGKKLDKPVGQIALHMTLNGLGPAPHVRSYITTGNPSTHEQNAFTEEFFPVSFATDASLKENLRFAFKYEALDLRIVFATLQALGPKAIEEFVRSEGRNSFTRRAWFFYEYFSGELLDLEPLLSGTYIDALDPMRHFVATPVDSPRHRIRNNLLGGPKFCPVLRRTTALEALTAPLPDQQDVAAKAHFETDDLAALTHFIYIREMLSALIVERDSGSNDPRERFLSALRRIVELQSGDRAAILSLQNVVIESLRTQDELFDFENLVAESSLNLNDLVNLIVPRHQYVPLTMQGWIEVTDSLLTSIALDAVLSTALITFAFVMIYPLDDVRGRVHRFMIGHLLGSAGHTPRELAEPEYGGFDHRHIFDLILRAYSDSVLPTITLHADVKTSILNGNEVVNQQRFVDLTPQMEHIYAIVSAQLSPDSYETNSFREQFDSAFAALRKIVDMPDNRARTLLKFLFQNKGRLSADERSRFSELTDTEISEIEEKIQAILPLEA